MKLDTLLLSLITAQLRSIASTLEEMGTLMTSNQQKLNQISADLREATDNVRAEFQALKDAVSQGTAPEQLDFSDLEQALNQLQQATSAVETNEPRPDQSLPQ